MKQKISKYGNVNVCGKKAFDSPSLILNPAEKDFYDNIEQGIKPLVKAFINNNFDTVSSCEGHFYGSDSYSYPQVSIIIEEDNYMYWRKYIEDFNQKNNCSVRLNLLEPCLNNALKQKYSKPVKLQLYTRDWGDRERTIQLLCNSINNKEYPVKNTAIDKVLLSILNNRKINVVNTNYINNKLNSVAIEINKEDADKWNYFAKRINKRNRISVLMYDNVIEFVFKDMHVLSYCDFIEGIERKFYTVNPKVNHFSILVKPTHRCNLDCKYCYDKPFREKIKVDMTMETLDKILKLLSEYCRKVTFIWHGGEPTMVGVDWFRKAYTEVFPKYPMLDFDFSIMSNGINYNDEWFDLFKQYKIQPGMSYNALHQNDLRVISQRYSDYDKAVKINKELENKLKNHKIGVIDVITQLNYKDQIKIYEYYKSINIQACMNEVFHTENTEKNNLEFKPEDYVEEFLKYFKHWLYDKDGIYERSAVEALSAVIGASKNMTCKNSDCRYKWLGIGPDGSIYHCDRYVPDKYRYGYITDVNSIEDIFKLPSCQAFYQEVQKRFDDICSKCGYFPACKGGCHGSVISSKGRADTVEKTYCEIFKLKFDGAYKILRDVDILNDSLNPAAKDIIIKKGFYSIKDIKDFIKKYKINISFKYDENNLLKCSEYELFRGINPFMEEENSKYKHVDVMPSNPETFKTERENDLINYLRNFVRKGGAKVVSE
jgi:uncharacterized protein